MGRKYCVVIPSSQFLIYSILSFLYYLHSLCCVFFLVLVFNGFCVLCIFFYFVGSRCEGETFADGKLRKARISREGVECLILISRKREDVIREFKRGLDKK